MVAAPLDTSPRQAAETLEHLARLRWRTRRSLGAPWFPLICFGLLTLLSAPVAAADASALAPLWLLAGLAGMLLCHCHYRQHARQRGVSGRRTRDWAVAVAMFVGCLTAGGAAGVSRGESAGVLAPILVVVAGHLALGWLRRDFVPSLALAPGAGLAIAFDLAGLTPRIVELTFGTALVLAGAGVRATQAQP